MLYVFMYIYIYIEVKNSIRLSIHKTYSCVHFGMITDLALYINTHMHIKSDLILKILNRHSRFYRYDAHDTIVLNHIHFGSLLVVRRRF